MELRRHRLPPGRALVVVPVLLSLAAAVAHGEQGSFLGIPSCYGPMTCGCGPMSCGCGSTGEMGGAAAGMGGAAAGAGDQLAGAPFDLGEAGPAQLGSTFAAADSGYIDDARIRTIFRARFDAGFNNIFPDRAEFFYAQCGCFGRGAPGPGRPAGPNGPATSATGVDYQEFWTYYEQAYSPNLSAFIDVPFRLVQFKLDPAAQFGPNNPNGFLPISNAYGFSDIQLGLKYALVADPYRYDTIQIRVYTPTGDAGRGLGTNHVSLEPAYLAWRQLNDRLRFNGEFRVWIPFSNDNVNGQNFAGTILRYGAGLTYDIWQSCDSCCNRRLSLVNEVVGWSVLGGLKFNPLTGVQDASGDTIVNYKLGLRYFWGNQSLYSGYGVALTRDTWYTDIFRAEYTYRF